MFYSLETTVLPRRTGLRNEVHNAFWQALRAERFDVIADLIGTVWTPFMAAVGPIDLEAVLHRRYAFPSDHVKGSLHRCLRAAIIRWCRRWRIDAPWMRNHVWRQLRFWTGQPELAGHVYPAAQLPSSAPRIDYEPTALRDRDAMRWFVQARVGRAHVDVSAVVVSPEHHVEPDSVRKIVNRIARMLEFTVAKPGRPARGPLAAGDMSI